MGKLRSTPTRSCSSSAGGKMPDRSICVSTTPLPSRRAIEPWQSRKSASDAGASLTFVPSR
eukprot:scaffold299890_cov36-Tisochrysis_lutea.AAC.1